MLLLVDFSWKNETMLDMEQNHNLSTVIKSVAKQKVSVLILVQGNKQRIFIAEEQSQQGDFAG